MKVTTAYLFLFLLIISNCFSQTTAIPDANFEQKLIDLSIDTNGLNGNILDSDAQAVTNLTLTGNAITNLTGLEAFVNVVTLNLGTNQFATVPLSTLTLLQELVFDQNVVLANLNLSNNVNLKKLDIRANGGTNTAPITLIDLSNNTQLEYIHIYNFKLLQNVIFPTTNTVEYVFLLMFADINVDFSGYDNLETLFLSTNFSNSLTINVVLPNNQTTLKSASFQGGNITNANLSTMLGLTYLSLQQTNTQTLQLPTTNTLKTIRISGHKIDNVNFANSSGLENLSITNKSVNIPLNIDISQNLLLKKLTATNNYMTNIDVTQNTLLNNINVSSNQLTSLNVDQNILLKDLDAGNNLLPFINLSQNVLLENLKLNNNVIPSLDLTTNVILDFVNISNNLFTTTGLDLTQNVLLTYFKASFNQIESLNISQNAILTRLILDHNLFSGTAILDQFYTLRLNNDGIYFGELDVSFNNLSGVVPNYTSLFHLGTPASTNWTRRFELYINNNNFEFGHFENQHSNYVLATNTYVPTTFTTPVMSNYWYAPQAKVNTINTINANAGDPITLTTVVSGAQNHYVWFKDGVQIPGAPDSPNYVINSVNPCDQGVYYCEILSDLVPFENANPPGTQGKNLKLTRNDITLNVTPATNSCPTLISPLNGATNVPINPTITWADSPNACSYTISIGTTSGGTQILNNVNVGDVNIYNLTSNLPVNTQIFITITPNYQSGPTPSCTEQSFTTNASVVLPNCTTLVSPSNGSTNVAINSNISWNAIANATGYFISIGTTSGGTNFVNNFDNGNSTTFNPTTDFAQNTTYFVTITPYNLAGNATSCASQSFTTQTIVTIPNCTSIISPSSGSTNVALNSTISWNAIANATGYFISIGTTSGGTNFVNNFDNGNSTTFNPTTDFAQNTMYFVTITPYNSAGNATSCASESFTTQTIVTIPNCTTLVSPSSGSTNVALNSTISWNAIANATGYFISYGTNNAANNIENMVDVGNVLTYNPPTNFPEQTQIYVVITPYNILGNATGCNLQYFDTETSVVEIPKVVLFTPSFFTPNGDGFNDIWQIEDPKNEVKNILIFDRFGKLLKTIAGDGNWNGTFNNQKLVSDDYWFVIEKKTGELLKGHFTLKR